MIECGSISWKLSRMSNIPETVSECSNIVHESKVDILSIQVPWDGICVRASTRRHL